MTLAEIRAQVRAMLLQDSTDAGTLLPVDNVRLDMYINMATEAVVLDLAEDDPTTFLDTENITLIAGTASYALTKEWLRIMDLKINVTSQSPYSLRYYDTLDDLYLHTVAETAAEPLGWTLKGQSIVFAPTPSVAYTSWATAWILKPEVATMATAGPAILPRASHRLIPIMAVIIIGKVQETVTSEWEKLYAYWYARVANILGFKVQSTPRFVRSSIDNRTSVTTRDPAFYDRLRFFD